MSSVPDETGKAVGSLNVGDEKWVMSVLSAVVCASVRTWGVGGAWVPGERVVRSVRTDEMVAVLLTMADCWR